MIEDALEKYPEGKKAKEEAWLCELGNPKFPSQLIDNRITESLKGFSDCFNGGPPCQAYSNVGRSRVGGVDENDNRVYLYKEYLEQLRNIDQQFL